MSFKVTWKVHVFCFLISYLVCFILRDYIVYLFLGVVLNGIIGNPLLDLVGFLAIIFIPITIVHELLHGIAYRLFGGCKKIMTF